ncbi:hypothetical protein GW915_06425 [bacterium]|nr:hypothetical protein [bacterium]
MTQKQRKSTLFLAATLLVTGAIFSYFAVTHFDLLEARPTLGGEVKLKDRSLAGSRLVLNGSSTHSRFIFEVYNLSLYLTQETKEASEIIEQVFTKDKFLIVEMRFLMDLTPKEFRQAWEESFVENCESYCEKAKEDFHTLLAQTRGFKRGDQLIIEIFSDHLLIRFSDQTYKSENKAFAKALLLTWIGKNPPSRGFKQSLLGNG